MYIIQKNFNEYIKEGELSPRYLYEFGVLACVAEGCVNFVPIQGILSPRWKSTKMVRSIL